MTRIAFVNNNFVPETEAQISVRDLALQRGYGVFDFFRVQNNQPLFLDDHLKRFYASAAEMRLPVPYDDYALKGILKSLIKQNNLPTSGLRITLTGGVSDDGYSITQPSIVITQSPIQLPTTDAFNKGIKLITYTHQRQLPHVKSIDYLMAVWLQPFLKQNNADDVLYQQQGVVTECPRSNFFIVTNDGVIKTPAANILKGISRNKIIEIAKHLYKIEEQEVTLSDIENAAEAFICSTTKLILPVVQINDVVINKAKPGKITSQLSELFIQATL